MEKLINENYKDEIKLYKKELRYNENDVEALINISHCYSQINIISHNSEHKKSLSGEHLSFRLMLLA